MAKRLLAVSYVFFVIFLGMVVGLSLDVDAEGAEVIGVYVFGDSTFDVGTNSLLPESLSRADHLYYGIDFPNQKITGRFSNGYNTADAIVQLMGYRESPPPYLKIAQNDTEYFKKEILKGLNFASGGSGLLHDTGGKRFRRVISMSEQIEQFATIERNMSEYLNGTAEAKINKSVFLISMGSNDIFELFLFNFLNRTVIQIPDFINTVMQTYERHLKNLMRLGARKFGILNIGPLGCIPTIRFKNRASLSCMELLNGVAGYFNTALEALLLDMSSQFPQMKYSLANIYNITISFIDHPAQSGFKEIKATCCGNLTRDDITPCVPNVTVCEKRSDFLFWDQHHPTDTASKLFARNLFNGGAEFVKPINFGQLVQA